MSKHLVPFLLLLGAFGTTGCASFVHADERPGAKFVGPVKVDRCAAQKDPGNRAACQTARELAIRLVHGLFTDDQICLDGHHPLKQTDDGCAVRAFVEGSAPHSLELEIREVHQPGRFEEGQDWWFHESALVDLDLRGQGFALPGDPHGGS